MTATATTRPKINLLIGWMNKNNRASRAASFLVICFDVARQTTTWNCHILTTATLTTTPQINDLIGWMKKNNCATRAARFLIGAMFWRSLPNDDAKFLTTTRARNSKSFLLCLYMKTFRTNQAKVHSTNFVQRDQHGIIAKDLTQSSILLWRFRCSCRRSLLNSLLGSFSINDGNCNDNAIN